MDYPYLHIGIEAKVFTYNINQVRDIVPATWITNLWDYISSINATITTESLKLEKQRVHDVSIMSIATKHYSGITMERINAFQLFLNVFSF